MKKWLNFGKSGNKGLGPNFTKPLKELLDRDLKERPAATIPIVLENLISTLSKQEHLSKEGIFRLSGSLKLIKHVRELLDNDANADLNPFDTFVLGDVFKQFLRSIPDGLIPPNQISSFTAAGDNKSLLIQAVDSLEDVIFFTLRDIIGLCRKIGQNEAANKMSWANIAVVMAPNLFKSENMADNMQMSAVIHGLIIHYDEIFESDEEGQDLVTAESKDESTVTSELRNDPIPPADPVQPVSLNQKLESITNDILGNTASPHEQESFQTTRNEPDIARQSSNVDHLFIENRDPEPSAAHVDSVSLKEDIPQTRNNGKLNISNMQLMIDELSSTVSSVASENPKDILETVKQRKLIESANSDIPLVQKSAPVQELHPVQQQQQLSSFSTNLDPIPFKNTPSTNNVFDIGQLVEQQSDEPVESSVTVSAPKLRSRASEALTRPDPSIIAMLANDTSSAGSTPPQSNSPRIPHSPIRTRLNDDRPENSPKSILKSSNQQPDISATVLSPSKNVRFAFPEKETSTQEIKEYQDDNDSESEVASEADEIYSETSDGSLSSSVVVKSDEADEDGKHSKYISQDDSDDEEDETGENKEDLFISSSNNSQSHSPAVPVQHHHHPISKPLAAESPALRIVTNQISRVQNVEKMLKTPITATPGVESPDTPPKQHLENTVDVVMQVAKAKQRFAHAKQQQQQTKSSSSNTLLSAANAHSSTTQPNILTSSPKQMVDKDPNILGEYKTIQDMIDSASPPTRPSTRPPKRVEKKNDQVQTDFDASSAPVLPNLPESPTNGIQLPQLLNTLKSSTIPLRQFSKYLKFVKLKIREMQIDKKSPEYIGSVIYYKTEKQNFREQLDRYRSLKRHLMSEISKLQKAGLVRVTPHHHHSNDNQGETNYTYKKNPQIMEKQTDIVELKKEKHGIKREIARIKEIISNLDSSQQKPYLQNLEHLYSRYQQLKEVN